MKRRGTMQPVWLPVGWEAMAEIRNYTMNFGSDMTCLPQVSLRLNMLLKQHVTARGGDLLRAKIHG